MAYFAIDKLKWGHSDGGLVCCPVCLECIRQLTLPALPHLVDSLLQDIFDLFVGRFCLTVGLRVVWSCNVVLGSQLPEVASEGLVNEV